MMTDTEINPEAQEIIDSVAGRQGQEWAENHSELILAQARLVGKVDAKLDQR